MSVKALVIGVSNYFMDGAPNLPFCKNDVEAMAKSLENGLGLKKEDIITLEFKKFSNPYTEGQEKDEVSSVNV